MPLVDNVDYPTRRIFLSAETVSIALNPVDVYKEVRALRRITPLHRRFLPIISARGNESLGATNSQIQTVLANGARIIPYDSSHTLPVVGVLVNIEEGLAGSKLFDRSVLSSGVIVDIEYNPPQVEVIEVPTGGLTPAQSDQLTRVDGMLAEIEPGYNLKQSMQLVLAVLTGKVSGAGTDDEIFRDINDTVNRLSVTVDELGNRSIVVPVVD